MALVPNLGRELVLCSRTETAGVVYAVDGDEEYVGGGVEEEEYVDGVEYAAGEGYAVAGEAGGGGVGRGGVVAAGGRRSAGD
jgi:myo-inositol-hexaphosphate 3-phosphohydrolase